MRQIEGAEEMRSMSGAEEAVTFVLAQLISVVSRGVTEPKNELAQRLESVAVEVFDEIIERLLAAEAAGGGHIVALEVLAVLAEDPRLHTRLQVLEALSTLGDRIEIDQAFLTRVLSRLVSDQRPIVRHEVSKVLALQLGMREGGDRDQLIRTWARSEDARHRGAIARALGQTTLCAADWSVIEELAVDPSAEVRRAVVQAAVALAHEGVDSSREALDLLSRDNRRSVRGDAIDGLATLPIEVSSAPLVEAARSVDEATAEQAADALAQLATSEPDRFLAACEGVIVTMDGVHARVVDRLIGPLQRLGHARPRQARALLQRLGHHPIAWVRERVFEALETLRTTGTTAPRLDGARASRA